MASKTYEVKLTAENSGLIRKLVESGDAVERAGSKMSSSASKHSGIIRDAFGHIGTAAHDVASDVVSNLGLPVVGSLAAVGIASVGMADTLEGAQIRLQGSLANVGISWSASKASIDHNNTAMENLGFTYAQTEDSLGTMVRATHNLSQAEQLQILAANIMRGKHEDLATATSQVASIELGRMRGLAQLGIRQKDATGHTISSTQALMELTQLYQGDASRYADSFAGKQAVLGAKVQDAGAKLGQWLIPKLQALASFLIDDVIPALNKTVSWVQTNWPKLQTAIAPTLDKIMGYIKGFVSTVQSLWQRFGSTILQYLKGSFNSIREIITGVLNFIMGFVRAWSDLFQGHWGKVWNDVVQMFKGAWQIMWGFLGAILNDIETIIRTAWDIVGNSVKTALSGIWATFQSYWQSIVNTVRSSINDIISAVGGIAGAVGGALKGAWDAIANAWNNTAAKVHIHIPSVLGFGGADIGVPSLPTFDYGGIVPGALGAPILALVHGGETVLPTHRNPNAGGGNVYVTVHLDGMFLGANSQLVPQVAMAIENQLMRHGQTGGGARWITRLQSTGTGS